MKRERARAGLVQAEAVDARLYDAACRGDLQLVQDLVDHGGQVALLNVTDQWDATPLYYAAMAGHYEVCEWLLQRGARADPLTFDGQRVVHAALTTEIRLLLKRYSEAVTAQSPFHMELARCVGFGRHHDMVLSGSAGSAAPAPTRTLTTAPWCQPCHALVLCLKLPAAARALREAWLRGEAGEVHLRLVHAGEAAAKHIISCCYTDGIACSRAEMDAIIGLGARLGSPALADRCAQALEAAPPEYALVNMHISEPDRCAWVLATPQGVGPPPDISQLELWAPMRLYAAVAAQSAQALQPHRRMRATGPVHAQATRRAWHNTVAVQGLQSMSPIRLHMADVFDALAARGSQLELIHGPQLMARDAGQSPTAALQRVQLDDPRCRLASSRVTIAAACANVALQPAAEPGWLFPVHAGFVSERCELLDRLLFSDFGDALAAQLSTGAVDTLLVVPIHMSRASLYVVLRYLYTGLGVVCRPSVPPARSWQGLRAPEPLLPTPLDCSACLDALHCADRCLLPALRTLVATAVTAAGVTDSTAIQWYTTADMFGYAKLKEAVLARMLLYLDAWVLSDAWRQLVTQDAAAIVPREEQDSVPLLDEMRGELAAWADSLAGSASSTRSIPSTARGSVALPVLPDLRELHDLCSELASSDVDTSGMAVVSQLPAHVLHMAPSTWVERDSSSEVRRRYELLQQIPRMLGLSVVHV